MIEIEKKAKVTSPNPYFLTAYSLPWLNFKSIICNKQSRATDPPYKPKYFIATKFKSSKRLDFIQIIRSTIDKNKAKVAKIVIFVRLET